MACFASASELLVSHYVVAVSNLGSTSGFLMELFSVNVIVRVATSLLTHLLNILRALVDLLRVTRAIDPGSALDHLGGEGTL